MLFEATTLAAVASAMAQGIDSYGCDSDAMFAEAGLDKEKLQIPGARYPMRAMAQMWPLAVEETGDPCFGLAVGRYIRPPTLHALGFSWLASSTLAEGLDRLVRYCEVVNTAIRVHLRNETGVYKLSLDTASPDIEFADEAMDAFFASVVKMFRTMSSEHFAPQLVTFRRHDNGHLDEYVRFFHSPVRFSASQDALYFEKEDLEASLPAGNTELAYENDRIAERYLATVDQSQIAGKVREILLTLLPTGRASEKAVAKNLHRSISSLQRALKAEGMTYKQILDDTRKHLAEQYVRDRGYSLSQIAYLLGFSDQSNFSRAFKRWTGHRPTDFRS